MKSGAEAKKRAKRTNPERSAATRKKIMRAVINILHKKGFSALSNTAIVEGAGVSSGALMHHFPSRPRLLAEMVEYAYDRLAQYRARQLEALPSGLARFRAVIDLAWATARMPEGIAVNEVRISARSNPEFAEAVRPMLSAIANDYGRFIGRLVHEAGLTPNKEIHGLTACTALAVRSLAIDRMTYPSAQMVENILLSLRRLREDLIVAQLGEEARQDPSLRGVPGDDSILAELRAGPSKR
ncbi:MAG: TetR/AcrR family transcriptional regulator [Maricaulaceae bacterium]